jgi:ferrous-iron efflux pump FieF
MDRNKANKLMKWATRASVAVALTLVVTKAVAWWLSSSVAMLGSLADSTLDLLASLVTLFAVKTAILPADHDHRFGHGKAEALAGLFQAAIMSGSAVFLLLEAGQSFWAPKPVAASGVVIQVSVLAIALSLALVAFQSYVIRKTGSLAVSGDHLHYKGDLLMNLAVVIAAYASSAGWLYADSVFGLLIALYILVGAAEIARPAVDMLMDRELSDKDRENIFNLALGNSDVLGLHELKTRLSGRDMFIQMHLEVDGAKTVKEAHLISGEVEAIIGEAYPDADILIHIDPPSERSAELTYRELGDKQEATET